MDFPEFHGLGRHRTPPNHQYSLGISTFPASEKAWVLAKCAPFHGNVAFSPRLTRKLKNPRIAAVRVDFRISGRNCPQKSYGIPLVYQGLGGFAEDRCHRHAFFVLTIGIVKIQ